MGKPVKPGHKEDKGKEFSELDRGEGTIGVPELDGYELILVFFPSLRSKRSQRIRRLRDGTGVKIHGFWPCHWFRVRDGTGKIVYYTSDRFHMAYPRQYVRPTEYSKRLLDAYWESVFESRSNESFWRSQWSRHGIFHRFRTAEEYWAHAIDAAEDFMEEKGDRNIFKIFKDILGYQPGQEYPCQEVARRLSEALGMDVDVTFHWYKGHWYIQDIRILFDLDMKLYVDEHGKRPKVKPPNALFKFEDMACRQAQDREEERKRDEEDQERKRQERAESRRQQLYYEKRRYEVKREKAVVPHDIRSEASDWDVYDFFCSAGKVQDMWPSIEHGVWYIEFFDAMSVPLALGKSGQTLLGKAVIIDQPQDTEANPGDNDDSVNACNPAIPRKKRKHFLNTISSSTTGPVLALPTAPSHANAPEIASVVQTPVPTLAGLPAMSFLHDATNVPSVDIGTPSEYLLLRNMCDPSTEKDPDFDVDIRKKIQEECSKYGTLQSVFVDKTTGFAYLWYVDTEAAQRAQQHLHGSWFAQRKIIATFISAKAADAR